MKRSPKLQRKQTLLAEFLRWFIGLRWLAGAGVVLMALIDWHLQWNAQGAGKVAVGAAILIYNIAFWNWLRTITASGLRSPGRAWLLGFAWVQIVLDVSAISLLSAWTGGLRSPLLGFFVLHMVFAALLLPRTMAYAGAGLTVLLMLGGLGLTHHWPASHSETVLLLGWSLALVCTVFVSSQIGRSMRRERRRLVRQTRKSLAMAVKLRRQQRRMAQHEKMVALGQMAAGVAHEIANPLASIDSLLQLMQRKPEKLKLESIETLQQQTERIARIVRELTTFSRPAETDLQTLPINNVVRESVRMLSFDPRLKKVRLEESLSEEAGAVSMLPQALHQVMINLLRNALDAMEQTSDAVLRVRTGREDGKWAFIEISDNGPGIETKNLKRLFEPFFTTKPVGKGTGLGLSISYSLITRHRGLLTAASKPGEGASFKIKLPRIP